VAVAIAAEHQQCFRLRQCGDHHRASSLMAMHVTVVMACRPAVDMMPASTRSRPGGEVRAGADERGQPSLAVFLMPITVVTVASAR
jgi:hypothetical protein